MNTKKILLAMLLAAAFAPAQASDVDADDEQRVEERVVMVNGPDGAHLAGPLMRMGRKGVKGAPYSAEVITERLQNLADGNQISNKTSSMSYRNSAGATRQDIMDTKGGLRAIVLHDPNEGSTITLHPQDKTGTKMVFKQIEGQAREEARAKIEQMRKDGRLERLEQVRKDGRVERIERSGGPGEEIVIKRVERADGEMRQRIREEVRVHVAKAIDETRALHAPEMRAQIGPVIAGAFGDMKWSGKATTRELGSKDIDGIKAEGKLRSYEIPAGELGNRNAIVVSDESWYSPELQVTVYSKHSDPRSGERIYRLANLKREEPAAALFTVPAGYELKEGEGRRKVSIEKKEKAEKK
jgi:hypothetical protein